MKTYRFFISLSLLVAASVLSSSCDTVIDVELDSPIPTFSVDAFLTDEPKTQKISLYFSQGYFDNSPFTPASSANVVVLNTTSGVSYNFTESNTAGTYTWTSPDGEPIGQVGDAFQLSINHNGNNYAATSAMGRVPEINDIVFSREEGIFGGDDFNQARILARDFGGVGDTYWIKAFKNGEFLDDPENINIAYDAGESRGAQNDGGNFEADIRSNINPTNDDETYELGDTVRVEIHSITEETFFYLSLIAEVINRPGGFAELFAEPLSNIDSNIRVVEKSENTVLGFFSVSAVNYMEVVFTEDRLINME